jgi:hypothetical protein
MLLHEKGRLGERGGELFVLQTRSGLIKILYMIDFD